MQRPSLDLVAPASRSASRLTLISSMACGLCAALFTFLMLGIGITVPPDGWAYWEGSVSILNGQGYVRFGGGQINAFPPLYPVLLAASQKIFGVSGATLILTTSVLAGMTVSIWSFARFDVQQDTKLDRAHAWLFALFVTFFIPSYFTGLLSETLFLPLYGLLVILINRAIVRPSNRFAGKLCMGSVLLLAMLLTRNASVVLIPPLAILAFLYGRSYSMGRAVIATAAIAGAVVVWLLVRHWLGQGQSHLPGSVGAYSWAEYLRQILDDMALRVAPLRFGGGYVVASGLLISGIWAHVAYAKHGAARGIIVANAGWSTFSLSLLFVLFNFTYVSDELAGRFMWQYVLHFIFVFTLAAAFVPVPTGRVLVALMMVVLAIQVLRTATHVKTRISGDAKANVQSFHTIRPDFIERPPERHGTMQLISPRDFGIVN